MRTIVALGGGQTTDPIRDYLVGLTGKERPKLLYLNTASAHDPRQTVRALQTLSRVAAVEMVEFFPWPPEDLRGLTLAQDIVFVGGGNTANMLALWRVHGFDEILREAHDRGVVMSGSSAGMLCWYEAGVTDSFGPQLEGMRDGVGFLPGSACPHYDGEGERRPVYTRLVSEEGLPPGLAADDLVALRFDGTELAEVVSSREGARAHRVTADGEEPIEPRVLG